MVWNANYCVVVEAARQRQNEDQRYISPSDMEERFIPTLVRGFSHLSDLSRVVVVIFIPSSSVVANAKS